MVQHGMEGFGAPKFLRTGSKVLQAKAENGRFSKGKALNPLASAL